jgi:FkbH-like protein
MYQFEWADRARWGEETPITARCDSPLPRERVASALVLHWEEHCVECAAPDCFRTCALYARRPDGNCARFAYGIYPYPAVGGLLGRGADVRFRRWGKLETRIFPGMLPLGAHRRIDRLEVPLARAAHKVASLLDPGHRRRRLDNAWAMARKGILRRLPGTGETPEDFVLECYSFHRAAFRLMLEEAIRGATVLRHSFQIVPGWNFHRLSAQAFTLPPPASRVLPRLLLYPADDTEARLVFRWLEFVRYTEPGWAPVSRHERGPAPTVKCVAWDLDNTLWTGILVENGAQGCQPREEIVAVVRALDERGILQTVVSKNDQDAAWPLIEGAGLAQYFLYPAINWGPKSENLLQIAAHLNIGLDSLALVDDSDIERAEVQAALPMVRVYSDVDAATVLSRPEFDVPITDAARVRRQSYLENLERERALARFPGGYLTFLRSCNLCIRLFRPTEESHRKRCLELIQRSNQLNLSTRRYSPAEFEQLLSDPANLCITVDCADRFGQYGIVGFVRVQGAPGVAIVHDFVLSCRVAKKRVEHSVFRWLGARVVGQGGGLIQACFRPTERNMALAKVLEDLAFCTAPDGTLQADAARAAAVEEVNAVCDLVG